MAQLHVFYSLKSLTCLQFIQLQQASEETENKLQFQLNEAHGHLEKAKLALKAIKESAENRISAAKVEYEARLDDLQRLQKARIEADRLQFDIERVNEKQSYESKLRDELTKVIFCSY